MMAVLDRLPRGNINEPPLTPRPANEVSAEPMSEKKSIDWATLELERDDARRDADANREAYIQEARRLRFLIRKHYPGRTGRAVIREIDDACNS